jgi:hypothetical protein
MAKKNTILNNNFGDYYEAGRVKSLDYNYLPTIKSVVFGLEDWEFGYPIIFLNKKNRLYVSFDELGTTFRRFYYRIKYCNARWEVMDLPFNEYAEGFEENVIEDYTSSVATRIPYVHYNFTIPNENIQIKQSGNYLLMVYYVDDRGEEQVAFVRRFLVSEQSLPIEVNVQRAQDLDKRRTHHQIMIKLSPGALQNPLANLHITVLQNGRWDNALFDLKPRYVKENEWIYDDNFQNIIPSMNEFRAINIKSIRYITEWVQHIQCDKDCHVFLKPLQIKDPSLYIQWPDVNGKFLIKSDDYFFSETQGEYVYVHLCLPYTQERTDGYVYITGGFTSWSTDTTYRMKYDASKKCYEKTLLLKQGYYDFQVGLLPFGKNSFDFSPFEGYVAEADNEYMVLVYYHDATTQYDRLLSVETKTTPKGLL